MLRKGVFFGKEEKFSLANLYLNGQRDLYGHPIGVGSFWNFT